MTELKSFRIIQGDTGGYGAPSHKCDTDGNRIEEWSDACEVYDKYEADKVIADRDYEIEKLKESISNLLKMNTEQVMVEVMKKALIYGEGFVSVEHAMKIVAELRHYKYKRCLDKAKLCERLYFEFRDLLYSTYNVELEHAYNIKIEHYYKWNRRWLELAEKFKG